MGGVATEAAFLLAGVSRIAQVLVTCPTASAHRKSPSAGKTKDLGRIAISIHVCLSGTMTGFTALFFGLTCLKELLMRRTRNACIFFVVTGTAFLRTDEA